ncbi:calcium-transporting ATPase 8, plasma membrane-type-like protein, partial [Tanacetum coccineum]
VHKDQKSPFLMSGCKVADGYGTMLVRLNGVATFIGIVGLVVAVAVLIILLARYFTGHSRKPDKTIEFIGGKTSLSDAVDGAIKKFTVAVTIVVVAVPEGLPLAVTLTLAYSMRKMMADKALVRRLSACETMGSATTICSDKTGTLTLNLMTVVEAFICGKKIDPPNNKSELPSRLVSLLIEAIAQNTTGSVFLPEGGGFFLGGMLKVLDRLPEKYSSNGESESSIVHAFPFNSEKKRGGVAVKLSDSEVHIHWKGAAEIVLAACTSYMDANDTLVPLDNDKVEYFKNAIETMAAGSLRCVAIAYRPMKEGSFPANEEELEYWQMPEDELVLLAIVGLKDPCRPNVKEAVLLCKKAGVKVRMVTGDNLQTARAIALECGILESNEAAKEPNLIEGKTFRGYTEDQRLEVADKISVMGRSSPNDKLLLVQALRKKGHVVAVTGDGTNDAPALHEADIGLAMGIQGTEVAKESSDIIILDDNFASVVKFQLTVNVAALVINVVAAINDGDVPLNAVQLLWVNLIMDTLGALALATEPPTDHLMDRTPVGRRSYILSKEIFNEFNARKPDEMNVFQGVTKNKLFVGIVGFTAVLQVIIIMFLGKFTTIVRLRFQLWLLSLGIGIISWPLAVVGKLIPVAERPFSEYFSDLFALCKPSNRRNRGSSRGNEDDS